MKTLNNSSASKLGRLSHINVSILAVALIMPAATGLAQNYWIGPTNGSADYNIATNWVGGVVPTGGAANPANDNGSNSVILIQAGDPAWSVNSIRAGWSNNASGSYLQTGSTNTTVLKFRLGAGNLGVANSSPNSGSFGFYTLSNGVINCGNDFNIGELGTAVVNVNGGAINLTSGGNFAVNNYNGSGANTGVNQVTDVLNQTAGIITVTGAGQLFVGNGGAAIYNLSGGTNTVNNYIAFGRSGGNGTVNMTGGLLVQNGGGNLLVGTGFQNPTGGTPVGMLNQSGGTINCVGQFLCPENSPATGTYNLSGTGVLTVSNWLAVGRSGGVGVLNLTNGFINNISTGAPATGNGVPHFDVGSGGVGTLNQYAGTISNTSSVFYLGETATGHWYMNGGSDYLNLLLFTVATGGGSDLELNGGLIQLTGIIVGTNSSPSILDFNGGTLQANASNPSFMSGLTFAELNAGGAFIDSQNYNITIAQNLIDNGGGGLTKLGSGTLTFTGTNTYNGPTIVGAGTVLTTTATGQSATGGIIVSNASGFGVTVVNSPNSQFTANSITFAGATAALSFDLGSFGNPTAAPLNVTSLTNNATVTVNIMAAVPTAGQIPLLKYTGSIMGAGTFMLGTLPSGSLGYLSNNVTGHSIDLVITSAGAPRWNGTVSGIWDINTTTNWYDLGTMLPATYHDGTPVLFDDNAAGTTNVVLNVTVTPASVTVNNSSLSYKLTGTGKISGSGGLTKQGINSLTLLNTGGNNFTGPVTISGGTLSVTNLANGGSASAIGASPSDPTNLVLAAGTLSYSGPTVSINRGYSLQGTNCTIDAEGNLNLSGTVTSGSTGDFVKTGPAQLTYTTLGVNALSGLTSVGYRTIQGTTVFDGSSGGQTNNVQGHFGVGGLNGVNASVILTNATLNVSGGNNNGIDLGRSGGATGTLSVNSGAVLTATAGNFALGDGGGLVSTGVVNQSGGVVNITGPQMFVGQNTNGFGSYNLSGGTFNINNWLAVGRQSGSGVFNLSGTGVLNKTGNGNLDIGTAAGVGGEVGTGTLNQSGGAITNTSQTWLGEGVSGQPANGTWNMSGGTAFLNGELHIGQGGNGTNAVNISGTAAITCTSFVGLALNDTSITGNMTIGSAGQPGGSLTAQGDMSVGDQGTSVLNMVANGGGMLTVYGTMYLSRNSATANGTVDLNAGSTIVAAYVNNGWGFGHNLTNNPNAFNFNGGTLKSYTNANPAFPLIQPYVNAVVQSGGAIIDDSGAIRSIQASLLDGGGGGGLIKLGAGTLLLDGMNTYSGNTMVTNGTLAGTGSVNGPVTVASGATLAVGDDTTNIASFTMNYTLTLAAGSTCVMKVTDANNDQINGLNSVAYNGSLVVTNTSINALVVGHQYALFNAAFAGSGNFSSVTVLSAVGGPYTGTFNPASGILTIGSGAPPTVNPPTFSGGIMTVTGTNGTPGAGYTWLATTNLANPIATWKTNTTGIFSSTGTFTNNFPVTNPPVQFFRLRTP